MPALSNTDVGFCNEALQLLGSKPIDGFDDGSDKASTCALLYPRTLALLLSMRTWNFTKEKRQLSRLVTTPIAGWKYAYQLPSNSVAGPKAVYASSALGARTTTQFEIFGDKLYTNEPTIFIDHQINPSEAKLPAPFSELLVNALAWKLGPSITEKAELVNLYREIAFGPPSDNMRGGLFAVAQQVDAKSAPNESFGSDEVVDARFS